jgi:transposase InsO family protein
VSEKSDFVETMLTAVGRYLYPVVLMCAWLSISRSGFYDWRSRPTSAAATRRGNLKVLITAVFESSDQTHGCRRVHADLRLAAHNQSLVPGATFHTDRACRYTSHDFGAVLKALDIKRSAGRTGISYVNARAESFFAALKNELVNRTAYPAGRAAMNDIARYIETRCNPRMLHSTIGYRPPNEVHDAYQSQQQAA